MNKAYQYRLYPTTEQCTMFAKTFGCCRKVYNLMLADKIRHYELTGKMLSTTPAQYKADYPFLKEVDSLALANEQLHLQAAYRNFFRDKSIGFPKFKSAKKSRKSYTTNNQNGTIRLLDRGIRLPKIGIVKAKLHRRPPEDWTLKSATVSQESDGTYFISVLFECKDPSAAVTSTGDVVGLDYKSDGLFMDSNGHSCEFPKYYQLSQSKLAKAQRKLKHMTIGSSNYNKQQQKINRIHRHIANQRKDHLHKLSAEIANQYDIVCVESLDLKAIAAKKTHLGKATLNNGYGKFVSMLEYKLFDRGHVLVKVDPWYPSSQICSNCGQIHKMPLSQRMYHCDCGLSMDRDHNAALNILHEGLRIFAATA